ncbi:Hypp7948 [Branchiostoma lanceolatum]|uniref:5'-AMP-activated protein kinase subunit beta-1 n=1 Tax=Branchiostoma lanceolatum TaxID=7740 RepID=A0A8J9Z4J9_BRALA|nr:Hypp7948 [Branchiostoma lanceolatum]
METVEDRLTADSTDEALATVALGSIEVAEKHALLDTSETSGDEVAPETTSEDGTPEKNAADIIEEVKAMFQSEEMVVPTATDFAEELTEKDPMDDLPPEEILQNVLSDLAERYEYNMCCLDQPEENSEAAEDHAESYEDSVDSVTLPEQQSGTTDRFVPEADEKLEESPQGTTLQDETGMDKISVDILETSKQMEHTVTTATVVEASEEVLPYKNNTTEEISSYTTSPSEIEKSALPHNHEKLEQLKHTVTKTATTITATATTTTLVQATEEVPPDTVKKLEQRHTNVILHMEQVGKTAENSFLDTSKKIEDEVAPETASKVENAEKNATDIIEEVKAKLQSEAMVLKTAVDFVEESADKDPMNDVPPEEILQNVLLDLAGRFEDNMDYVTLPEQQNVSEEAFTDTVERLEECYTNETLNMEQVSRTTEDGFIDISEKIEDEVAPETTPEGETAEKNAADIIQEVKAKLQSEAMVLKTATDLVEESADNDPMADLLPEEILQSVLSDLAVRNEDNMDYVTLPEQQNASEEVFTDTIERPEECHTNTTTLHTDENTEPRKGEKAMKKTSTATPPDVASKRTATDILKKTEGKPSCEIPSPDENVEAPPTDEVQNTMDQITPETSQNKTSENSGNKSAIVKPPDDTLQNITVDDVNHNAEKEAIPSNETTDKVSTHIEEKVPDMAQRETQVFKETTKNAPTEIHEKVLATIQEETQLSNKTTENAPTEMVDASPNKAQLSKTTKNAHTEIAQKVADTADTQTTQPESSVEKPRRRVSIETRPMKRRVTITLNDYSHIKLLWQGESNGSDVFVCGSWDGWSRSYKLNRGEYSVTLSLPVGMHEYKFQIGNSWFHDKTKARSF